MKELEEIKEAFDKLMEEANKIIEKYKENK